MWRRCDEKKKPMAAREEKQKLTMIRREEGRRKMKEDACAPF
jgi:hypothetical protein